MPAYEGAGNHAPKRKHNLTIEEKMLAVKTAFWGVTEKKSIIPFEKITLRLS
jgi:hypothetical protein